MIILIFYFPKSLLAEQPEPLKDLQCGCYPCLAQARQLIDHLNELKLSWYCYKASCGYIFIVDLNLTLKQGNAFMDAYPALENAFLVENHCDPPLVFLNKPEIQPSEEVFISIMASYMRQQYQDGYYNRKKLSMSSNRAKLFTSFIYNAAKYYSLDPFLLFAVGNFETYFRNMYGDLHRLQHKTPDPALGMFQILRSTAKDIYMDMKRQKHPHTPDEFPDNLITHPKTQIYFAAHYIHKLYKQFFQNSFMAILAYNGLAKPNCKYPLKIQRFYDNALKYFKKAVPQT